MAVLTYNKPLKLRSSVKFDVKIFLIILVLTYLLAYKLTDYAANFKTIKHQSRIEIIFLTIFFILLFIPMSQINKDEISLSENRVLAKWQPFIKSDGKINFDFGTNFNKWFNDRFNLRKLLIDFYIFINYNLAGDYYTQNGRVIDKAQGIIYHIPIDYGYNMHADNKILSGYLNTLNRFQEYLKTKNIKVYFIIAPRKYDYFSGNNPYYKGKDNIKEVVDFLNKNSNIHFIYLKESFDKANKTTPVFFKTDPHWTNTGIYLAFEEMLKEENIKKFKYENEIKSKAFYNKKVIYSYNTKVSEFHIGNVAKDVFQKQELNKKLEKKFLNTDYIYYSYKNPYLVNYNHSSEIYYNPDAILYKKALIFGNSFSLGIVLFAPYLYKNIKRQDIRIEACSDPYNVIKEYDPDVIIFVINSSYFDLMINDLKKFLDNPLRLN